MVEMTPIVMSASKLWSNSHRRDRVKKACRQSLENLGLDHLDFYLIHTPDPMMPSPDTVYDAEPGHGV